MKPICTYPRAATSTASPAHKANGWGLLDPPGQASLQPRKLPAIIEGGVCFPFGHRLACSTSRLSRIDLRPTLGLPRGSVCSCAQWPLCPPRRARPWPSRSANATKLFRAPRHVRRVGSRTEISQCCLDPGHGTRIRRLCRRSHKPVQCSPKFDARLPCGFVELPLLS